MDHNSQAPPQHHQAPPHAGGMMAPSNNSNHHQMVTMPPNSSPVFPFNSGDGSSGLSSDPTKKKRGRPRKYSPEAEGGLGLAIVCHADTPPSSQKHRGRPPGSGKRQLDALGNCGVGFTPHVIFVKPGEDIASKIVAFSQQGPRTVCVLSANGSICNVTLRQPTSSGGSVTYEGRFEIISLTGSFLVSENDGNHVRTGGLSISLARTDGRVVGGGVAGVLVAATPVQIIVGSFVANGKKPKYMPTVPESRMLHFRASAPSLAVSPPSQLELEEASTESSEDNVNGHIDPAPGPFNHSAQHMYSSMEWPEEMLHHQ